jgi:hypothetical protein
MGTKIFGKKTKNFFLYNLGGFFEKLEKKFTLLMGLNVVAKHTVVN